MTDTKLIPCPCCGYPCDETETKGLDARLNQIKADTIRELHDYLLLIKTSNKEVRVDTQILDIIWNYSNKKSQAAKGGE